MSQNLTLKPFLFPSLNNISFAGTKSAPEKYSPYKIPKPLVKTPRKDHPVSLEDVSYKVANQIAKNADKLGISRTDYLLMNIKSLSYIPAVSPEPSKTAIVGNTNVTTLIDGEQIFDKAVEYVKSAKKINSNRNV